MRLNATSQFHSDVRTPDYQPAQHGVGIVHLGVGAFHRAHQAVYTDDALAAEGGDWRIAGISLRSSGVANNLNPQDGLYSLLVRDGGQTDCRIVGSLQGVTALRESASGDIDQIEYQKAMSLLCSPDTRIVSLTVTEKAYAIARHSGGVDTASKLIQQDLATPEQATGVVGIIVNALRIRLKNGVEPFTVVCCDNLPGNGNLLKAGVVDFASRIDNTLGQLIDTSVAFPNTMVDRITPATTPELLLEARSRLGLEDLATVETEAFSQWVVEDTFPTGRPSWQTGGAVFVSDVAPYEMMKLRMLNGAHSLIAYAGYSAGFKYVRDAMTSPALCRWVDALMLSAANTLSDTHGIDYAAYAESLKARFRNPAIAHETYQIAMDGTEKLPQRIFEPLSYALQHDQNIDSHAFAIAAWIYYCRGINANGVTYPLRDPREDEIAKCWQANANSAEQIVNALSTMQNFMPDSLASSIALRNAIIVHLNTMLEKGMTNALEQLPESLA